MTEPPDFSDDLYFDELARRDAAEDAERLAGDLRGFLRAAWAVLEPEVPFQHNWHIDAYADHLSAVTNGEIRNLQIWVPPGMMKSRSVTVLWPAWEWIRQPWLRYWTATYELGLAGRLAGLSKNVMQSPWYQVRWGHVFRFDKDGEKYFSNNKGGTRLATAPGSTGMGEHGNRIVIDDPINGQDAEATSKATLDMTNSWYDGVVQGRKASPTTAVEVIIMQRLHENDLAAHAYEQNPEAWTILCLPERYEHDHDHVWIGDPRKQDGELLWPSYRDEAASDLFASKLGPYRRAGQMQQRPSAKEGDLLKRYWWRFYHPDLFTDENMRKRRPRFAMIVQTVDAPLKDKEVNDLVAIQAWGVVGGDRYLLDLKKGHMSKAKAKRAILEQARYVRNRKVFGTAAHHLLIEKGGYGPELISELKLDPEWRGGAIHGLPIGQDGNKQVRAEGASSSLEGGNCFLPGYRQGHDELSMPDDDRNAAEITDFIDSCAVFPNGTHDDDVDAWSQCMNWLSDRPVRRARVFSAVAGR